MFSSFIKFKKQNHLNIVLSIQINSKCTIYAPMINSKIIAPLGIPAIFDMSIDEDGDEDIGEDVVEDAISRTEIKHEGC